jgi:septum formation protein
MIVLASASPRRADLLSHFGHEFQIVAPAIDETPRVGEAPLEYVVRLAAAKAGAVWSTPGTVVIAADTTVDVNGHPLGKPANRGDAAAMLRLLAGRTHAVHTGVAVVSGGAVATGVDSAYVTMGRLSEAEIDWYLDTGEPFDKAGAYAVQGRGGLFVERVEGNVQTVIGLPLGLVRTLATSIGVDLLGATITPQGG